MKVILAVVGFIPLPVGRTVVWSGFEGWLFHPDETPYGEEIPSTAIMGLGVSQLPDLHVACCY